MSWLMVFGLVDKFGPSIIGLAEKLWQLTQGGLPPTQADWDALRALASQTATSQMTDALVRAGIDLNSPNAKALLALTAVPGSVTTITVQPVPIP